MASCLRNNPPSSRLLLACEVLSPGTRSYELITKRKFFQSQGVRDYWIVGGDEETFEIWHPESMEPRIVADHLSWARSGAYPPWQLEVREFFSSIESEYE